MKREVNKGQKEEKKEKTTPKENAEVSPFSHLDASWKKVLDYTPTPVSTPLPCGQSEEDGTGKNLAGY